MSSAVWSQFSDSVWICTELIWLRIRIDGGLNIRVPWKAGNISISWATRLQAFQGRFFMTLVSFTISLFGLNRAEYWWSLFNCSIWLFVVIFIQLNRITDPINWSNEVRVLQLITEISFSSSWPSLHAWSRTYRNKSACEWFMFGHCGMNNVITTLACKYWQH